MSTLILSLLVFTCKYTYSAHTITSGVAYVDVPGADYVQQNDGDSWYDPNVNWGSSYRQMGDITTADIPGSDGAIWGWWGNWGGNTDCCGYRTDPDRELARDFECSTATNVTISFNVYFCIYYTDSNTYFNYERSGGTDDGVNQWPYRTSSPWSLYTNTNINSCSTPVYKREFSEIFEVNGIGDIFTITLYHVMDGTGPTENPNTRNQVGFGGLTINCFLPTDPPTSTPTTATVDPSKSPTKHPSISPTKNPSISPTKYPTMNPSVSPVMAPTSDTDQPTGSPSQTPTSDTDQPTGSPTKYPTLNPTIFPTEIPTKSPSNNPSANPSHSPSQLPSKMPSKSLTRMPSKLPTLRPSYQPTTITTYPTISPTRLSAFAARQMEYGPQITALDETYETVTMTLGIICAIVALGAYIDAKWYRINDYFKAGAIISMTLQTMDMLSDCFFVINIHIQNKIHMKLEYDIVMIGSIVFIVVPAMTALFQLYFHLKKHWMSNNHVRQWLSKNATMLLLLSVMTGSSFAAVALLNSFIFQMHFFHMGLITKELKLFNMQRVYSVVLIENIPQLILQLFFIISSGNSSDIIAITSIIFSCVSIIVSIMGMALQKNIGYTQSYTVVEMDITGHCVVEKLKECRTMCAGLGRNLSILIGVDTHSMEIIPPKNISKGLKLRMYIYIINDQKAIDYKTVLMQYNQKTEGELANAIKEGWKLDETPKVSNIQIDTIESEKQKVNSKSVKKNVEMSIEQHTTLSEVIYH